jgi:[acyl-carrier-protein] S-malonyltransferase
MSNIAIVFSGQGSQFVGMGSDFYEKDAVSKSLFDRANAVLGYSLSDICFNGPEETLNLTQHTQVAIFVLSACIFERFKELPTAAYAGHSLGEITAYYAAGVLDFESALHVVIKRGELMGDAAKQTNGKMSAILGLSQENVNDIIGDIQGVGIANYNSPAQFVISGAADSVDQANAALNNAGAKRVVELPVSGAFHSPLMESAVAPFETYLSQFTFHDANTPIILNRLAQPETNAQKLKDNLSHQIQSSVRWIETIQLLSKTCDRFIEVGPGKVLSGLIKKINRELIVQPTSSLETVDDILKVEA